METIMVMADDGATSIVLAMILRSRGYSVLEATGWDEAVRQCEERAVPVDVLTIDDKSLESDLAESIKQLQAVNPNIRILFLCDSPERPAAATGLSGVTFVQKPTSLVVLARVLREVLESARQDSIFQKHQGKQSRCVKGLVP